ncbi:MAG TPA: sigma-70 family RNA polymerase sigma factor [Oculatellaceae cyanobacterium]
MILFFNRRKEFEKATMPFAGPLFGLARWRLTSMQDAEDAVQETFLRAYRSFDTFQPGSNMRAWLFKILLNVINDMLAKTQREVPRAILDENMEELEMQPSSSASLRDPQVLLEEKEFDQDLTDALACLPPTLLQPLLLREIEDFTYQEIATVLDIAQGTVMSRLFRARQLVRKHLRKRKNETEKVNEKDAREREVIDNGL